MLSSTASRLSVRVVMFRSVASSPVSTFSQDSGPMLFSEQTSSTTVLRVCQGPGVTIYVEVCKPGASQSFEVWANC